MMRIAIAEDDILFAETVKARIDDFFTARGEPARVWYGSSQAMLALLETRQNFDIYLFDVIMPEINGLTLAEKVYSLDPGAKILLLTSYDRFALAGIRLGVYYYILKDNYWPELSRILERICREQECDREGTYLISTEISAWRIPLNRILYLTKEQKYTLFHYLDDRQYKERGSLGNVFRRLPSERFIMINRGMVINMKHVLSIERLDITMRDGNVLPVSRYEKTHVLDKLTEYWRRT